MTRRAMLRFGILLSVMLTGCTPELKRPSGIQPSGVASAPLRQVPIGLIDLVVSRVLPSRKEEVVLISLPDEIAIKQPRTGRRDNWLLVPSALAVPATDLLRIGLLYEGLSVEKYRHLAAAKSAGARFAVLGLLTRSDVLIEDMMERLHEWNRDQQNVTATVKGNIQLVDLSSMTIAWQGPLETVCDTRPDRVPTRAAARKGRGYQRESWTGLYEVNVQAFRAVLAECYIYLASRMIPILEEVAARSADRK